MNAIISVAETPIRQLNGLYSLNDLHRAAGGEKKHQPANWLRSQQAIDLIKYLESEELDIIQTKQRLGTFVCKELVVHYGMWISPEFSLQVIRAFLDQTVKPAIPAMSEATVYNPTRDGLKSAVRYLSRRRSFPQVEIEQMLKDLFGVSDLNDLAGEALIAAIKHVYSYAVFGEQRPRTVVFTEEQVEDFTSLLQNVTQLMRSVDVVVQGLEALDSPLVQGLGRDSSALSWLLFRCLTFLSPPDRLDLEELLTQAADRPIRSQLL